MDYRELPDGEKREQLVKSYEGQVAYNYKRIERAKRRIKSHRRTKRDQFQDINNSCARILAWEERIRWVKEGHPLEEFVGKQLNWKKFLKNIKKEVELDGEEK